MKIKKLLILASIALVGFSSCSKDEEGDSTTPTQGEFAQELIIDGTTHDLGEGFIMSSGQVFGPATLLTLFAVESSINMIYDATGAPDSSTGSGLVLALSMFSPDSAFASSGTYTVDTNFSANSFTAFGEVLFISDTTGDGTTVYELVSGSVEVANSNGLTSFVGTLVEPSGKEIKVSFQKSLVVYDAF